MNEKQKRFRIWFAGEPGNRRAFIDLPRDTGIHFETAYGRRMRMLGASFRMGDRGSNSPIKFMLGLYWIAFWICIDTRGLGALCEKIGRGHKREIAVQIHHGAFWWRLWYDDDGGWDNHHSCDKWRKPKLWPWSAGRRKYRGWMCLRDGHIEVNPIDAIWGEKRYSYNKIEEATKTLNVGQFEGDSYELKLTLREMWLGREHGPSWVRREKFVGYDVDWRTVDDVMGIPIRNHEWKGDGILASSLNVDTPNNWRVKALVHLVKYIEAERVKNGYKHDPKTPERPNLLDVPQFNGIVIDDKH